MLFVFPSCFCCVWKRNTEKKSDQTDSCLQSESMKMASVPSAFRSFRLFSHVPVFWSCRNNCFWPAQKFCANLIKTKMKKVIGPTTDKEVSALWVWNDGYSENIKRKSVLGSTSVSGISAVWVWNDGLSGLGGHDSSSEFPLPCESSKHDVKRKTLELSFDESNTISDEWKELMVQEAVSDALQKAREKFYSRNTKAAQGRERRNYSPVKRSRTHSKLEALHCKMVAILGVGASPENQNQKRKLSLREKRLAKAESHAKLASAFEKMLASDSAFPENRCDCPREPIKFSALTA